VGSGHRTLGRDHYRNIMTDIGKGVLTPAEIRGKTKQVSDDAVIAPARRAGCGHADARGDHRR